MGASIERIEGCEHNIVTLAHTAATTAWKPVFVKGLGALIPLTTKDANVVNSFSRRGRYEFAITTSASVSRGNPVYYATATDTVQATVPAAGFYLGVAAADGTATSGFVDVLINEVRGDLVPRITTITDAVDTAPTLTAAQVIGGIIKATPTAARAHTLPTAAALLALVPNAIVGSEVRLTFVNAASATHAVTITDSTSITNGGVAAHATVAAATSKTIRIVFDSITTDSETAKWYLE